MHKIIFSALLFLATAKAIAQGPNVTSWLQNTSVFGTTQGANNNILTNCQAVYYDASNVYIKATSMAGYDIGPWPGNPNTPSNQNNTWKITKTPTENLGVKTKTPLGGMGVFINGVQMFNQKDAHYWDGTGFVMGLGANWNRNALYYEGPGFDACLGHPNQTGAYHNHVNPTCLYDDQNTTQHSPIIGYAFDGFPVYGPYAYTNVNGTGPIKRMKSSYVLNATRTGVPTPPPVNATYPLGCLCEDYTYSAGAGDLDAYNGRFCITPEYPSGTYAYFVTVDSTNYPVYPFIIGNEYYGTVQPGNTGPGAGNNTIPGTATQYIPTALPIDNMFVKLETFSATPVNSNVEIKWSTAYENSMRYFTVERSKTGGNWENIFTTVATNQNILRNYSSTDYAPMNGISYYRLKAVNTDGKEYYSEVQRIDMNNLFDDINIYPNPFDNAININTDGSTYEYRIINNTGQVMSKGTIKGKNSIDTHHLADGIYFLELTNAVTDITKTRKILKK